MKTCNSCETTKPLSEFSKASSCKDGHRNYCKACHAVRKERWRQENLDSHLEKQSLWQALNKDRVKAIKKKWRESNPEYSYTQGRKWRQNNPEKARAQVNSRRHKLRVAKPALADTGRIQDLYQLAATRTLETGEAWHVDHIIPLRGRLVSGLHVENNLRVVPAKVNLTKSNKFEEIHD